MDNSRYCIRAEAVNPVLLKLSIVARRIDNFSANSLQELENLSAYLLHFYKHLFIYELHQNGRTSTYILLEERKQEPRRKSQRRSIVNQVIKA